MAALTSISAATSSGAGDYLHWGVIQISVTNALIIAGMVIVFVLALVLPFPGPRSDDSDRGRP